MGSNNNEASQTPGKSPSRKTRRKPEVRSKKPKLPLYNKKAGKNHEEKQVKVDDILKNYKLLDDGVVPKGDNPYFDVSDANQLMPSSSLKRVEELSCLSLEDRPTPEREFVEAAMKFSGGSTSNSQDASEDIVPFSSQLLHQEKVEMSAVSPDASPRQFDGCARKERENHNDSLSLDEPLRQFNGLNQGEGLQGSRSPAKDASQFDEYVRSERENPPGFGSPDECIKHLNGSRLDRGGNSSFFNYEENAAPSVLDVSDFQTCQKAIIRTTSRSSLNGSQNHSVKANPSYSKENNRSPSPVLDIGIDDASLQVHPSLTEQFELSRCPIETAGKKEADDSDSPRGTYESRLNENQQAARVSAPLSQVALESAPKTNTSNLDIEMNPQTPFQPALPGQGFPSFSTGSGKRVSFCSEKYKDVVGKYQRVLDSGLDSPTKQNVAAPKPTILRTKMEVTVPPEDMPDQGFPSFSTGSGKRMSFCSEKYNNVVGKYQCILDSGLDSPTKQNVAAPKPTILRRKMEVNVLPEDMPSPVPDQGFPPFSTRSGKRVSFGFEKSKDIVDKSQQIFDSGVNSPTARQVSNSTSFRKEDLAPPDDTPSPLPGLGFPTFSTGSGKAVSFESKKSKDLIEIFQHVLNSGPESATKSKHLVYSKPNSRTSTDMNVFPDNAPSPLPGRGFQSPSSVHGMKTTPKKSDKYRATIGCPGESNSQGIDSMLVDERSPGNVCPNSTAAEATPKPSFKKPRLDSFLDNDTELFEKVHTPSKVSEVDCVPTGKLNRGVNYTNEVRDAMDVDNDGSDSERSRASASPILDLDESLWKRHEQPTFSPAPSLGSIAPKEENAREANLSLSYVPSRCPLTEVAQKTDKSGDIHGLRTRRATSEVQRCNSLKMMECPGTSPGVDQTGYDTMKESYTTEQFTKVDCGPEVLDDHDSTISAPTEFRDHSSSPLIDLDFDVVKQIQHSTQVDKRAMESGSDWEDFPELKSSQAALLEQSAKKENISLTANRQTPARIAEREAGPKETASRSKPCQSKTSQVGSVSTPLSSRGPLAGGAKRKSLPASLELAAKKPKPSPDIAALRAIARASSGSSLKANLEPFIASKKIIPAPGILYQKKQNSPLTKLADLKMNVERDCEKEVLEGGNDLSYAPSISPDNAVDFRFHLPAEMLKAGWQLIADGCSLFPGSDGTVGCEEVASAFFTCPHVDRKLVPDGWVKNHYRWIVWKLFCYDRLFPRLFDERCLSVENVLLQLKYRYDREIDRVQRSCFKKLLEGDAAPSKFICCVATIKKNRWDEADSLFELELTDGWYSIWAVIDSAMEKLVGEKKMVEVGTKLVVHGAEMTNCEQGCDPLKVPSNVRLKISTNSVRRARWYAKMGFVKSNNPIPNLLCDLLPEGGIVGKLTTVIVRKYPLVFMCKDANGKTVFRNERAQDAFQKGFEKRKSDHADVLREKLLKEVESRISKLPKPIKKYTPQEIACISDPEELYSIVSAVGEDSEFLQLSTEQERCLSKYREEMESKIRSDVQKQLMEKWELESNVTKLQKVRFMDSSSEKHAVITFWRPTEDEWRTISENKPFSFFNIAANATRDGVLQLSSTRHTTLEELPPEVLPFILPPTDVWRVATPLKAVGSPNFSPAFGELDTVGVVVLVKLPELSNGVSVVYLSDLDGHFVSITFWTSLGVFGCEDLMAEGSLIACSNLQWRPLSSQRKKIPSVFASEITSFTKNPKPNHLKQHFQELESSFKNKNFAESVASAKAQALSYSRTRDLPVGSPAPPRSSGTPTTTPGPSTSTPQGSSSRSTPARQRLEALNRFEDAPPLTPMPLSVSTRKVFQNFISPRPQNEH